MEEVSVLLVRVGQLVDGTTNPLFAVTGVERWKETSGFATWPRRDSVSVDVEMKTEWA
jgi:hypothetical protein